ncbi:MAG: S26 family signal peptidase [Bryobacteraceae bacterium]
MSVGFFAFGLRINVTASIPLGLYIRSAAKPAPGLIAEFCPAGMSESQSERYRGFGLGCQDRSIPLLKPIVAVSGDRVDFSLLGIAVNGKLIPNTAPRKLDGKGRPLRPWPSGQYTVEPDKIVVASAYHPGSYDSRYLGPIPIADVKLNLRPFWILPLEYRSPGPKS